LDFDLIAKTEPRQVEFRSHRNEDPLQKRLPKLAHSLSAEIVSRLHRFNHFGATFANALPLRGYERLSPDLELSAAENTGLQRSISEWSKRNALDPRQEGHGSPRKYGRLTFL